MTRSRVTLLSMCLTVTYLHHFNREDTILQVLMPRLIEITHSTCYRNPVKIQKFHKVAQTSAINIESRYWQYTCQKQHGQHKAAKKSTHNQLLLVTTRSIQFWESVNGFSILGGEIKNPYHGKQKNVLRTTKSLGYYNKRSQEIKGIKLPFFPSSFLPTLDNEPMTIGVKQ